MAAKTWMIRGVDKDTKRKIRGFAGANDIVIAEALKRLVEAGEKALAK